MCGDSARTADFCTALSAKDELNGNKIFSLFLFFSFFFFIRDVLFFLAAVIFPSDDFERAVGSEDVNAERQREIPQDAE